MSKFVKVDLFYLSLISPSFSLEIVQIVDKSDGVKSDEVYITLDE